MPLPTPHALRHFINRLRSKNVASPPVMSSTIAAGEIHRFYVELLENEIFKRLLRRFADTHANAPGVTIIGAAIDRAAQFDNRLRNDETGG
ncbi:hypothetical protein [Labrys monachus]|uniref:Uncharacterized protein n=1 Tax=Labrys monachus TaxID=217067 RepID=A0ABU0FCM5_9HYPH|nr:hypothetical protein [Labrys monachus]MDQ0391889.1 hypothetical protein [Labrys monachus]